LANSLGGKSKRGPKSDYPAHILRILKNGSEIEELAEVEKAAQDRVRWKAIVIGCALVGGNPIKNSSKCSAHLGP